MSEQTISINTILPAVPELFVDERNGEYLLLNPRGPHWCVGSKVLAVFVELCDDKRSIQNIFELMEPCFNGLTQELLIQIALSLQRAQFFTDGNRFPINSLSKVTFNITKLCNLNCPFCYYDSIQMVEKLQERELNTNEWVELAHKIAEINPKAHIHVSGGEPMIRDDVLDILEGIAKYKLQIVLITNGTHFTLEKVSRLSSIPKLTVQVSIDSIVPKENQQTRGPGALEKALATIQWMKSAGINVKVSSTITQINKNSFWRLKKFCAQNNISFGTSMFFIAGERSKKNSHRLQLTIDEFWETCQYNGENLVENIPYEPEVRRYNCGIGYGSVAIQPDGTMSPCNHLFDQKQSLGNIKTSTLYELLNVGYKRYNFIDVDKMNTCSKCPVRYLCAGGCRASSLHNYGTMHKTPPECSLLKKVYIACLWIDTKRIS